MDIETCEAGKDMMLRLGVHQDDKWKVLKSTTDCTVYEGVNPVGSSTEKAMKIIAHIEHPTDRLINLIDLNTRRRLEWDNVMGDLTYLETYSQTCFLVHHLTNPTLGGLISPRDSIDLCYSGPCVDSENRSVFVVCAVGTKEYDNHSLVKHDPKVVRVSNYMTGFMVYPVEGEPDKSRFVVIFDSDIKLNSISSLMFGMVKPRIMLETVNDMKTALDKGL